MRPSIFSTYQKNGEKQLHPNVYGYILHIAGLNNSLFLFKTCAVGGI
jgi:hypothetical protein